MQQQEVLLKPQNLDFINKRVQYEKSMKPQFRVHNISKKRGRKIVKCLLKKNSEQFDSPKKSLPYIAIIKHQKSRPG
jgi:hypothetical protein